MAMVIPNNVGLTRIADHICRTLMTATAHGDDVAATARARLATAVANIEAAAAERRATGQAAAAAWARVLAVDARSRVRIGVLRDELWSALGRPRTSPYMLHVFPSGVTLYTAGDPRRRPVLIGILKERLASCPAPALTTEQHQRWAAELEDVRTACEDALDNHRPTAGPAALASSAYRNLVRVGHDQLRIFKRDLQNLSLTKAQIFAIIPDATPTRARVAAAAG